MATGVIGLGNIGGAIAANLVADGNDVVVHDVDAAAMAAITGATAAPDVASVARQADVTLLSLPTPDVVAAVAIGLGRRRRAGRHPRRPVHEQPDRRARARSTPRAARGTTWSRRP